MLKAGERKYQLQGRKWERSGAEKSSQALSYWDDVLGSSHFDEVGFVGWHELKKKIELWKEKLY